MRFIKTFTAAILCAFSVLPATAQIPDSVMEARMTRRVLTCGDIVLNATTLLPRYHNAGHQDSVEAVLDFIHRRRCGRVAGPVEHYAILYAVDTGGMLEGYDYVSIRAQLMAYHRAFYPDSNAEDEMWSTPYTFNYLAADGYFDFLKSYGTTLVERTNLTPAARWIARYYASGGDTSLLRELSGDAYTGTPLQQDRKEYKRMVRAQNTLFYGAVTGGVWAPQGALNSVGRKTLLGMDLGVMMPKGSCALSFYGLLGDSRLPYNTYYGDSLLQTDYFSGIGLGIRGDYAVLKTGRLETTLGAGVGYESITLVKDETPDDGVDDSKDLGTLNMNAGVGLNYYAWRDVFISAFGRYNVINYRNDGGTSFSGNAWMVGIGIGFSPDVRRVRTGQVE